MEQGYQEWETVLLYHLIEEAHYIKAYDVLMREKVKFKLAQLKEFIKDLLHEEYANEKGELTIRLTLKGREYFGSKFDKIRADYLNASEDRIAEQLFSDENIQGAEKNFGSEPIFYQEWQRYFLIELFDKEKQYFDPFEDIMLGVYNIPRDELNQFISEMVDQEYIEYSGEKVGLTGLGRGFVQLNKEFFSKNDGGEIFTELLENKLEKGLSHPSGQIQNYLLAEFISKHRTIRRKYEETFISIFNTSRIQDIAKDHEFYHEKARDSYYNFHNNRIDVPRDKKGKEITERPYDYLKEEIDSFYKSHPNSSNKYLDFLHSKEHTWSYDVILKIGVLIAHIDTYAANKVEWNSYNDKRTIANSQVSQRTWFKELLTYKEKKETAKINSSSVENAILYLSDPLNNSAMLSNRHKEKVFKNLFEIDFDENIFELCLKELFSPLGFVIKNKDNEILVYTRILYSDKVREIWDIDDSINKEEIEDPNLDDVGDEILEDSRVNNFKTKKATAFWSDAATDLDEFGRESLVNAVVESTNKLFNSKDFKDSYSIHLNGEWGAGKSSMLKFFKKELEATKWKIVEYNAWENQAFNDPWWILINAISKRSSQGDFKGEFSSHRYWKFKLQYRHKFLALVLLGVFIVSAVFFFNSSGGDPTKNLGFYAGIVGLVGAIISVITGLTNNFFYKDVSKEDLKRQFSDHPFKPIQERFDAIAEENDLAIFIDDLDRCDVEPTVTLLEGIQNLFKGKRVLYIIAADGAWVSQCFSKKYQDFTQLGGAAGSIGDKFLQKSFQLRVDVPEIAEKTLEAFWDRIINDKSTSSTSIEMSVSSKKEDKSEETSLSKSKSDTRPSADQMKVIEEFNAGLKQQFEEFNEDFEDNQEAFLKRFLKQGVSKNPRQMKRFVNQYKVAGYQKIVEIDSYEFSDLEIKQLIFQMNYPMLYELYSSGVITEEVLTNPITDNNHEALKSLTENQLKEIKGFFEE